MSSPRRLLPALLLTGSAFSSVLAQSPAPSLPDALSNARAQGCSGRQGVEQPFRQVPALADAARRIAQGASLESALSQAKYRATRSFQISLRGYGSAAAAVQAVRSRWCEALTNPELSDVGVYRRGDATWIVLADPFSPPEPGKAEEVARQVLELVNRARGQPRQCGDKPFGAAPALTLAPALHRAAELHSRDMARNSFMAHQGSDGSTVSDRVDRAGYDWRTVGENVAAGPETAEQVVQGWLQSPDHCANIMQPAFTEMGVAWATDRQSQAGIYWTQVLARPRS
ncbi:CAP domain-containing protein [Ramlibacter rhizophilus]|uniref:CAP domain-containing protein n=1 Tax=Ramlibacter rhizophilus TaxID=1781167 RepID=A0A4Z0BES5_9BURK|nr:CAP domain-containing protein [Ramlibacter rhizophilus]TFY96378.1 CAP domain-containing protein [Ramlibacter rhizophilus]